MGGFPQYRVHFLDREVMVEGGHLILQHILQGFTGILFDVEVMRLELLVTIENQRDEASGINPFLSRHIHIYHPGFRVHPDANYSRERTAPLNGFRRIYDHVPDQLVPDSLDLSRRNQRSVLNIHFTKP